MRVIQLKKSKVLKFASIGLIGTFVLFLMARHFGSDEQSSLQELLNNMNKQNSKFKERNAENIGPNSGRIPNKSHPDEVATFTGTKPGNFEPVSKLKVLQGPAASEPGENGRAHKLRVEQKQEEEKLKGVYGFNQLASDEITLNRTVPDLREPECQFWDYPKEMPKASVILVFHNEGWSTLFRTVNSVINRSPPQFFEEVVLVDDKSEMEHLHERLDEELKKPYYKGRVKLVRNKEREGLIRSRNNGAIAATGEVVIFLDAHCEVGYNWLPPLLAPIHADRRTLSVPVIDGVNWNDFGINPVYAKDSHSRGLFEWGMLYKEGNVPSKEEKRRSHHSEPYYAPTHAGGLFAINREYFKELGWYDPGLWVWGGENFELSFKVWMCGGNSVWVPCSRIAHVYRGHSCSSCHSGSLANKFKGQPTTLRNYKRVIETWFDPEYKEYFYTREPLARFVDMGDISEQLAMKKRMNCKSFDWFMKEVAYDIMEKYPRLPPNQFWGDLINVGMGGNQCLDTYGRHPPEKIGASHCHHQGGNQMFRLNTEGQLTSGEWCTNADSNGISVAWCAPGTADGPWEFRRGDQGGDNQGQLFHTKLGKCMSIDIQTKVPTLNKCDSNNAYQTWHFKVIEPYWAKQ